MMNQILALLFQGVIPMFLGLGNNQWNGQAKSLEGSDVNAIGQFGGQAAQEGAQLNPFFSQEMKAQHGFTPGQTNELLTNAEGGAGGAFGGADGQINANAARTGNATTITKSLDEMARDKAKAAAGSSEGIAAQDVAGAKQENQAGAQGMQGLYGINTQAQLASMKQADQGIQTEQATQGQNWLQQLDQIAKFGGDVAGDITGGVKASDALQGR